VDTTTFVAGAATHVGNVREHNEDAHLVDVDHGLFAVCDGMGGHAAGEVASGLAIEVVRERWAALEMREAVKRWAEEGTPVARRGLVDALRGSVMAAHAQIVHEAEQDHKKRGMGTTFVGCVIAGGDALFGHAGDSRAYLVRDGIAMQLTEDHTLLARLAAAGIDVTGQGEESRWKGVLTNALGIGDRTSVSSFVLPLDPGDRLLLCSDGVTEYVVEREIGEVLTSQPSPARAAQRLIELALERGGGDNATAVVVKVLEVGTTRVPAERRARDAAVLGQSTLLGKLTVPQRLRVLKIASERELPGDERIPAATLGDRVAWLILDGKVMRDGAMFGAGDTLYPESLLPDRPAIEKDGLASPAGPVRALAFRRDDFHELTVDDADLAEPLFAALAELLGGAP
jgi:PPM family protein phosphatase